MKSTYQITENDTQLPRSIIIECLSQERGRLTHKPLHTSLISKWCADLGLKAYARFFTAEQMQQLRAMNLHYARGGTRYELLEKMKGNPEWYASKN